jgi:hypothetical protein
MSNTLIATRAGWITDPGAVIDAVQSALREALKIPEGDRTLRLIEHPPSHFAVPPGRGEKFTLIEVTMFSGRSTCSDSREEPDKSAPPGPRKARPVKPGNPFFESVSDGGRWIRGSEPAHDTLVRSRCVQWHDSRSYTQ